MLKNAQASSSRFFFCYRMRITIYTKLRNQIELLSAVLLSAHAPSAILTSLKRVQQSNHAFMHLHLCKMLKKITAMEFTLLVKFSTLAAKNLSSILAMKCSKGLASQMFIRFHSSCVNRTPDALIFNRSKICPVPRASCRPLLFECRRQAD